MGVKVKTGSYGFLVERNNLPSTFASISCGASIKGNGHLGSGKMDRDTLAHPQRSENLSAEGHFERKRPCFGFCLFFQEPVTTHLFLTALEGTNLSKVGPPLCPAPPPPPSVQTVSQNALDLVLQGTVERGLKAIFLVEILSLYGLLEFLRLCHSICLLNTSCVNMGCLQSLYECITSQCKVCTLHLPASRHTGRPIPSAQGSDLFGRVNP